MGGKLKSLIDIVGKQQSEQRVVGNINRRKNLYVLKLVAFDVVADCWRGMSFNGKGSVLE